MSASTLNPRRISNDLQLLAAGAVILMIVLVGLMAWRTDWSIDEDKRSTLQADADNGLVAVRALEEHAAQTFHSARRSLENIATLVAENDRHKRIKPGDTAPIRQMIAQQHIEGSRHLKALQFISLDGSSWITSPDYPAHQEHVGKRSHIAFLLANPKHPAAVVGHPYASPYDSQIVVPMARLLFGREGQALGIISADIRLTYFGELYSRMAKDNKASVALISEDGFVIVRSPFEARYADRDISTSPALAQLKAGPNEGSFFDDNFLDDEFARHYVYRKVSGFPMMVLYGRDTESVLAVWEERRASRLLYMRIGFGMLAVLIGLIALLGRNLRRSREQLLVTQEKFFGLFEHSPMPLVLIGYPDNIIMEINRAWADQLGYDRDEVLGRDTTTVGIWIDLAQRNRIIEQLLQAAYLPPEDVQLRHKDGRTLTFSLSASEFEAGQNRLFIFNLYDVNHQRAIEQEIRDLNTQLEERVASRTTRLETANAELTRALTSLGTMQDELIRSEKMAALGSLVAGVAHELNTPIGNSLTVATTIEAHAETFETVIRSGQISRRQLGEFVQSVRDGSSILTRTLNRAAALVSSFKQVAVDQTSDTRRRFALRKTLEEILTTLDPIVRKTPHNFVLGEIDAIEMDSYPGALTQLINNFMNNSLLHGFEGRERGTMRLTACAVGAEMVEIMFSDDGVGISEDNMSKVFDPFYTTKLGSGGSGLGMHIAYNLVSNLLGGTVRLSSQLGQGLTITVRIPRVAPTHHSATNITTGSASTNPTGAT
jgi:PAS domain S-box-containing protein